MELSVYAYPHIFLYDGRGADKPWLQELPEPVTQIVWDSWAEMHPETARKLGVAKDDVIEIKTEHGAIEAPVLVESTVRPGVIAVPLGQGHRAYGRYAKDVGANAWAILAAGATYAAATARATGKTRTLVSPLGNSDMMGRSIVEAMSIEQLARGVVPKSEAEEVTGPFEMYAPWKYAGHKWGMTIDVNACTGCSACVTACYAENNVPWVGRDGVDQRANHVVDSHRALLPAGEGSGGGAATLPCADAVPAVRSRAVRAGLPGVRVVSHRGRASTARFTIDASARAIAKTTVRTRCADSTGSCRNGPRRSTCNSIPT